MENLELFIQATINANRELYKLIKREKSSYFEFSGTVGSGGDCSIGMDILAESIFLKHLSSFGKIDSEECGVVGEGNCMITIDPLDGSNNYKSGFPYFGSSVALEFENETLVGIVTNLVDGTLFLKSPTKFVYTNLESLKFYDIKQNPYANVGIFEQAYRSKKYAKKLKNSGLKYRIPGAIALSLAYANRVQFFIYEGKMRHFDAKAGLFMCAELYQHEEKDLTIICNKLEHFNYLKKLLL